MNPSEVPWIDEAGYWHKRDHQAIRLSNGSKASLRTSRRRYSGGIGALLPACRVESILISNWVSMYDIEATVSETGPTVLKLSADCTRNEAVQVKPHTSNQPGPNQTGMRDIC
jgi:hypothetical protein